MVVETVVEVFSLTVVVVVEVEEVVDFIVALTEVIVGIFVLVLIRSNISTKFSSTKCDVVDVVDVVIVEVVDITNK